MKGVRGGWVWSSECFANSLIAKCIKSVAVMVVVVLVEGLLVHGGLSYEKRFSICALITVN